MLGKLTAKTDDYKLYIIFLLIFDYIYIYIHIIKAACFFISLISISHPVLLKALVD